MKKMIYYYALWIVGGLIAALLLVTGGVKLTSFCEASLPSGCGPSLLHLFLHFAHETGVLGAIGGLIVAPVLILVIVGSFLAFAAYHCSASTASNKYF